MCLGEGSLLDKVVTIEQRVYVDIKLPVSLRARCRVFASRELNSVGFLLMFFKLFSVIDRGA